MHTPSKTTGLNFIKMAAAWFQGRKTLLQSRRRFFYTCGGKIPQTSCVLTASWSILKANVPSCCPHLLPGGGPPTASSWLSAPQGPREGPFDWHRGHSSTCPTASHPGKLEPHSSWGQASMTRTPGQDSDG